jgi:TrkA family protein
VIGVASLLLVLALASLITRIATVALRATGLSEDVARFQARSAFWGVGFTTAESEHLVNHPVRRRILLLLMLLSSAGVVTTVASLMLSFAGTSGVRQPVLRALVLAAGIVGLWLVFSSTWVDRRISRVIEWGLARWTDLDARDYARLLDITGDYAIAEIRIDSDDWLAGRPLADLHLPDEGVVVLGIYHLGNRPPCDGGYEGAPRGDARIHTGDRVVLYGTSEVLVELRDRTSGPEGDRAHEHSTARHRRRLLGGGGGAQALRRATQARSDARARARARRVGPRSEASGRSGEPADPPAGDGSGVDEVSP